MVSKIDFIIHDSMRIKMISEMILELLAFEKLAAATKL